MHWPVTALTDFLAQVEPGNNNGAVLPYFTESTFLLSPPILRGQWVYYAKNLIILFLFISNSRIKLFFANLSRLQFFHQIRLARQVLKFVFIK